MRHRPLTPEDVIGQMSLMEVRELLGELSMDSTVVTAMRLKQLVLQLGDFEAAIAEICGPPSMRDVA